MQEVIQSYEHDPIASQLIIGLIIIPEGKPKYSLAQGIIRYDQRIYVAREADLRPKIFRVLYHSFLGGHSSQ